MEQWFIYSMLSAIVAGLSSFMMKVSAEKNYNSALVLVYVMVTASILSFITYFLSGTTSKDLLLLFIVSIVMGISYLIVSISRIESLKNIASSIYFPIYKSVSTVLAFIVGYYAFSEYLGVSETIGTILGLLVPLVLINKKTQIKEKNFKKGIILCFISVIMTIGAISMGKIVMSNELNPFLYVSIANTTGAILTIILYKRRNKKIIHSNANLKTIGIMGGIFMYSGHLFFVQSLAGNLVVVYTINGFSIIITIMLSIAIYKESLDIKKILAIVLTVLSILFFRVF